jgi:dihydrofolate synthase/folylpolyglutamate synthase
LAGRHQAQNLAVAVRALELLPAGLRPSREAVVEGVASVRWPGRLQAERIGDALWIFDLAHNAAGVRSLVDALGDFDLQDPVIGVIGVLGDKDWNRMLPPLFEVVDGAVLVEPPSAPPERRWNPDEVLRQVPHRIPTEAVRPFAAGLARAGERAAGGTAVCTGSAHTVGDAMLELGVQPFPEGPGLPADRGLS